MARRIAASEVAGITTKLLAMQKGLCAVCGHPIKGADRACLDHDHTTGYLRGVLHLSCNGAEGKIKVKAYKGHKGVSPEDLVIGLGKYLEHHRTPKTRVLHHSHLTADETRLKRNKRARTLRARKQKE